MCGIKSLNLLPWSSIFAVKCFSLTIGILKQKCRYIWMTGKTKELVVSSRSVDSFCRLSIRTDNYIKKVYGFVPNFVPLHGYLRNEIRNVRFRKKFAIESSRDNEDRDMACFVCDERFSNDVSAGKCEMHRACFRCRCLLCTSKSQIKKFVCYFCIDP